MTIDLVALQEAVNKIIIEQEEAVSANVALTGISEQLTDIQTKVTQAGETAAKENQDLITALQELDALIHPEID
jgi:hypothetical protein